MVMPSATGLFHRAIAQSVPGLYFTEALATDIAAAITGHLGLPPSARELARLSPSRLNDAADEVADTMAANPRWGEAAHLQAPFAPVVDGEVLPAVPWQALAGGAASGVELIVGHTRDEYRLFMAVKGELGEITPEQTDAALRVLAPDAGAYRAAHPAVGPERLYELLHSDWLFRMPSLRLAEAHHPHGPTHLYELTWNAPGMGGETLGACHGLGLPLTFGNLTAGAAAFLIGHRPAPEAAGLATRVRAAWTAFAATGDPGWPVYDPRERHTWIIDTEPAVGPYPEETSRRLWADHPFAPVGLAQQASTVRIRLASAIQSVACAAGTPWPERSFTAMVNALSTEQTAWRWPGLLGSKVATSACSLAISCVFDCGRQLRGVDDLLDQPVELLLCAQHGDVERAVAGVADVVGRRARDRGRADREDRAGGRSAAHSRARVGAVRRGRGVAHRCSRRLGCVDCSDRP